MIHFFRIFFHFFSFIFDNYFFFFKNLPFGQMVWRMNEITITYAVSTMKRFSWVITQWTLHLVATPMATILIDFGCNVKIFWCSKTRIIIVGMICHYTDDGKMKVTNFIIYALIQWKPYVLLVLTTVLPFYFTILYLYFIFIIFLLDFDTIYYNTTLFLCRFYFSCTVCYMRFMNKWK